MTPRWRLALDVWLNGLPAPPEPAPPWDLRSRPLSLARPDAWDTDDRKETRAEAALSLMDADVCGFFMLVFHADGSPYCEVTTSHVVDGSWWPAIAASIEKVRSDM